MIITGVLKAFNSGPQALGPYIVIYAFHLHQPSALFSSCAVSSHPIGTFVVVGGLGDI